MISLIKLQNIFAIGNANELQKFVFAFYRLFKLLYFSQEDVVEFNMA